VATLVAIGAALIASHHLTQARQRVVDRVDVATNTSLVLANAMVNQETGVRGFVLGGEEGFLNPYRAGAANARRAERELQVLAQGEMGRRLPGDLAAVRRAIDAWESEYAQPTIERIRRFGAGRIENAAVAAGKTRFDAVRATLGRMQADLRADGTDARADLASAAASLTRALVFAAILLALALLAIAIIGRQVIAVPIARLARQTRAVASGELHRVIEPSGPSDIERLGRDVESMRERIVRDLEAVRAAEEEL
jgi:CHASE3 domain sensor protein